MTLFMSSTTNKVDAKGRVSVPAAFRAVLAGQPFHGIVALPSFKYAAIQCGGMDWMEQLNAGVSAYDFFSDEHDTLTATLFSRTEQLGFDGEGRVVLPTSLIEHANLTKTAAFVGRGPLFEIWDPEAFTAYQSEATKRAAEQNMTLRPPAPPGGNGGAG
ncbi:MAG: division/cell wall cluster transcriptional repressor MraZ [Alphaproteobacteria bacterium]|nr:division/cell wall cluster transcriptional repressor MraZ [Alphaproteobacteria bacterium]